MDIEDSDDKSTLNSHLDGVEDVFAELRNHIEEESPASSGGTYFAPPRDAFGRFKKRETLPAVIPQVAIAARGIERLRSMAQSNTNRLSGGEVPRQRALGTSNVPAIRKVTAVRHAGNSVGEQLSAISGEYIGPDDEDNVQNLGTARARQKRSKRGKATILDNGLDVDPTGRPTGNQGGSWQVTMMRQMAQDIRKIRDTLDDIEKLLESLVGATPSMPRVTPTMEKVSKNNNDWMDGLTRALEGLFGYLALQLIQKLGGLGPTIATAIRSALHGNNGGEKPTGDEGANDGGGWGKKVTRIKPPKMPSSPATPKKMGWAGNGQGLPSEAPPEESFLQKVMQNAGNIAGKFADSPVGKIATKVIANPAVKVASRALGIVSGVGMLVGATHSVPEAYGGYQDIRHGKAGLGAAKMVNALGVQMQYGFPGEAALGPWGVGAAYLGGHVLEQGTEPFITNATSGSKENAFDVLHYAKNKQVEHARSGLRDMSGILAGAGAGAAVGSAFFGVGAIPGAVIGGGTAALAEWQWHRTHPQGEDTSTPATSTAKGPWEGFGQPTARNVPQLPHQTGAVKSSGGNNAFNFVFNFPNAVIRDTDDAKKIIQKAFDVYKKQMLQMGVQQQKFAGDNGNMKQQERNMNLGYQLSNPTP